MGTYCVLLKCLRLINGSVMCFVEVFKTNKLERNAFC